MTAMLFFMSHTYKNKISFNSISIPDLGWRKEKGDNEIYWTNPEDTITVSINYFDETPDIPTIKNVNELTEYHRSIIEGVNGELIGVEVFRRNPFDIVRTLAKLPLADHVLYIGDIAIPFSTCLFSIKVRVVESNPTSDQSLTLLADLVIQLEQGFTWEPALEKLPRFEL